MSMTKVLTGLLILLGGLHIAAAAQSRQGQDTVAKGIFILHKFQQAIGKESYSIVRRDDSLKLQSNFKFTDRGQAVPSQTTLVLNKSGEPVYFKSLGSTSRSSVVDAEVRVYHDSVHVRTGKEVQRIKIPNSYFTISGYSPVAVQMALLKFWKQHGKPQSLPVFPGGSLKIKLDGYDSIHPHGEKKLLERYFIKGLIWGSEIAWTYPTGELVALFTNDAEGDKFEAITESFESALPDFISKAARYGMANLKQSQAKEKSTTIALINGNIIDVISGKSDRGTVIIENGMITRVGSAATIRIPKSSTVIDLKGKSVLPGLWDMHVHTFSK